MACWSRADLQPPSLADLTQTSLPMVTGQTLRVAVRVADLALTATGHGRTSLAASSGPLWQWAWPGQRLTVAHLCAGWGGVRACSGSMPPGLEDTDGCRASGSSMLKFHRIDG